MLETIGSKKPKTIKDFFNTKKWPGKRGIYKSPMHNLEMALAASGTKVGKGGAKIYEALETEAGLRKDFCLLRAGECCKLSPHLREEHVADQAGAGSALSAHIADQLNALLQRRWQPHRCWVPPP